MPGIHRYPRPQLQRPQWTDLNGPWEFAVSDRNSVPESFPEVIEVPYPPESKASGIGRRVLPGEFLWYRKTVLLEKPDPGFRLLLHLEAVDQTASLFINGTEAVHSLGGYHPISADITELVHSGENMVLVRAEDPLSHDFPWGKQKHKNGGMWYTPFSGIWQSVWMETVPERHITGLQIRPALTGFELDVSVSYAEKSQEAEVEIETPSGLLRFHTENLHVSCTIPEPRLWAPEDPWLYPVTVRFGTDSVSSYAALRTVGIETMDGIPRLLLNGKPYFFHALLDQGYWPGGICTPPDDSGYETDIRLARSLGFNTLRKHIRIEPLTFYADCDRLGMLVFQDMVNTGPYSFFRDTLLPTLGFTRLPEYKRNPESTYQNRFLEHLEQTALRLGSCPCIALWTIFNEGWGQFDSSGCYEALRRLDPDRPIDTASGWFRTSHTDIESLHVYFRRYRFRRTTSHPVVLTEFGGYAFTDSRRRYGYRFFTDPGRYSSALSALYRDQILPAVPLGLCGCVYTQLTDVEEEQNGLITADRSRIKADQTMLLEIADLLRRSV